RHATRNATPRHVLRLAVAGSAPVSTTTLERSAAITRERLRLLGVRGARVRVEGRELVVSLPRAPAKRLVAALTERGRLALYDLEPSLAPPSRTPSGGIRAFASLRQLLRGGKVPPDRTVVTCGKSGDRYCPGVAEEPRRTYYYLFKRGSPSSELTGADLKAGGTRPDLDENGSPEVVLEFTSSGGEKFRRITQAEYLRGRALNAPQHFAVVFDDDIKSSPQIDYTDPALTQGISGGARITGIGSLREAKALGTVLESGALPVKLVRLR